MSGIQFNALIPEFHVTDLDASRDFYVGALGFKVLYERPDLVFLEMGGAQIMITNDGYDVGELEAPLGRGMNLEIEVPDLEPLLTSLSERGVKLYREPHECLYDCGDYEVRTRQFLVQDPDGYLLRFSSSLGDKRKN